MQSIYQSWKEIILDFQNKKYPRDRKFGEKLEDFIGAVPYYKSSFGGNKEKILKSLTSTPFFAEIICSIFTIEEVINEPIILNEAARRKFFCIHIYFSHPYTLMIYTYI